MALPEGDDPHQGLSLSEALHAVTPRVWVTPVLLVANVAWFAVMVIQGVSPLVPDAEQLLSWGGNYGPSTTDGQWWRLLSCAFVHAGVWHIGMNMWILKDTGPLLERLTGGTGFAIVYLASALAGSLGSMVVHPVTVAVGASGAIFGVIGALLGVVWGAREDIPRPVVSRMVRTTLTFVVLNVVLGMQVPAIDMAAHGAGFVAGALLGWILARPDILLTSEGRDGRNLLAATVGGALVALLAGLVPVGVMEAEQEFLDLARAFDAASDTYGQGLEDAQQQRIDEAAFVDLVRGLLPEVSTGLLRLEALAARDDVELPERLAWRVELLQSVLGLREESWRALVEAHETGDEALYARWRERQEEADRLLEERLR